MIVWLDTSRKHRRPPWLSDDQDGGRWASRSTLDRGTLWCAAVYADRLDYHPTAEWVDLGDGWQAASYSQVEPAHYLRTLHDALVIDLVDVTGITWCVPALLTPDGAPAIGMRNTLVTNPDGSVAVNRSAATPLMAAALAAAQAARPHAAADFDGVDVTGMMAWCLDILAAMFHLDIGTMGKLGLVGDTLLDKGIRRACGLLLACDLDLVERRVA